MGRRELATGRCTRGDGGRHLLWTDPAHLLVVVSHWGEDVEALLREVAGAVDPRWSRTPGPHR